MDKKKLISLGIDENGNHFHASNSKSRVRDRDSSGNIAMGARALLQGEQDKHVRSGQKHLCGCQAKENKKPGVGGGKLGKSPLLWGVNSKKFFCLPGFDYIIFLKKSFKLKGNSKIRA